MENSVFSLLPPLLAIVMVILTRRVLLSLGVGIVLAALLIAKFNVMQSLELIWQAVTGIFVADGTLNTWNVFIILFLFTLGIVTVFININGGSRAFGEWAMNRVKTRIGAQLTAVIFGIAIFIDDYFNSLVVGQISRPITDRHRVSRAKLAYIIDSTAAPVCVVSPISSWGAYIIGIIGSVFATHSITNISAFSAFVQMIPMNFYVWSALGMVLIIAIRGVEFGPMKKHEDHALATGEVFEASKAIPGEFKTELPISSQGKIGGMIWPIVCLIIGTVAAMMWTGARATEGKVTIMAIFENTDIALSLLFGGLAGLIMATTLFITQSSKDNLLTTKVYATGLKEGIKSMVPAVLILLFAWAIITLIDQLKTGTYLAGLVEQSNMSTSFLPFILFLVAGLMAFSTGTSWGSFGILLPIAGEISAVTDISLILPTMAAVLAGAVFGDHCSPISDTTILSSTGAGSNHMDHVITQLPYACTAAALAAIGYLILGLTASTIAALSFIIISLAAIILLTKKAKPMDINTESEVI